LKYSEHPPGTKWIDSNGEEWSNVPWAEGQPDSSVHCVVIDSTLN